METSRFTRAMRRRMLLRVLLAAVGPVAGWPRIAGAAEPGRSSVWPSSRPTPPLDLDDLAGRRWTLAALAGRPVVVNFWATWCGPCRTEMPSLVRLAARHRRAGLVVLAVNYRESVEAIGRFTDALPLALPILLDRDGEAALAWTPRVFPTTVLVDRSGTARHSVVGGLDWIGTAARGLIEPLLARPRAA